MTHFPWTPAEPMNMEGKAIVMMLCVCAILGNGRSTHNICRGILIHSHGKAVILDEYALMKLSVSIIHENENNLKELRVVLEKFRKEMTNPLRVRVIEGLLKSVDEELGVKIGGVKRKKRSLLPFAGQALKSMFGVSTEADHQ